MALSLLATEQELAGITTVAEARTFAGLPDATWQALSTRLGGVNSLRLLAMQPISALQTAMQATRVQPPAQDGQEPPPERELTSVECTQLALMFRVALQKFALPDANPLAVAQAAPAAAVAPPTTPSTPLTGKRKVKANTIIDQGDEMEITLLDAQAVEQGYRQLKEAKGGEPTYDAEPTPDQMSAMNERLITLDLEPYADFALFTPYGRRFQRQLKLKNWVMDKDGSYRPMDVPGPADYETWDACWRIYANCLLTIAKSVTLPSGQTVRKAVMTVAALEHYQECFRKLVASLPECWHLCAVAEDRCRGEHFPRLRRLLREKHSKGTFTDYDDNCPWISVMMVAADDDKFWDEQVRRPATLFLARGGQRGGKRQASEALNEGQGNEAPSTPRKSKRQRQMDRKVEKEAKKLVSQQAEASATSESGGGAQGQQAQGKGGSKGDQSHPLKDKTGRFITTREGAQICFSFQEGKCKGPCPRGRQHVCQYCLQGHRNNDCKQKKNL